MKSNSFRKILCLVLLWILLLSVASCGSCKEDNNSPFSSVLPTQTAHPDLGGEDVIFGQDVASLGIFNGRFQGSVDLPTITCLSGTAGAYSFLGNKLIFTELTQDSVYAISGKWNGTILIGGGNNYKLDLELHGFTIQCDSQSPIRIQDGKEVSLTAKKDTVNYIYDLRPALSADSTQSKAAIDSAVDLEIAGKGTLFVVSEHNNGIATKDDLQVKNLNLTVYCQDNALKGNDGVEITLGQQTLIATMGDGIVTKNSHISQKGNQKGNVTIDGSVTRIFSAKDGIDCAHDVIITDPTTNLSIYTDKYALLSQTHLTPKDTLYLRADRQNRTYSIKYYKENGETVWENATYQTSHLSNSGNNDDYHTIPRRDGYAYLQVFTYNASMEQGQEQYYLAKSDLMAISPALDTIVIQNDGEKLFYHMANYQNVANDPQKTQLGRNSAKGIRADNGIFLRGGAVAIKSYDVALSASNAKLLDNGLQSAQVITLDGSLVTLYCQGSGIDAGNLVTIANSSVSIDHCYNGIVAKEIVQTAGILAIVAQNDGLCATKIADTALSLKGGVLSIRAGASALDVDSATPHTGLIFTDTHAVLHSSSPLCPAVDTRTGYTYVGGNIVITLCHDNTETDIKTQNFSSIGTVQTVNLIEQRFLTVTAGNQVCVTALPKTTGGTLIYLGSTSVTVTVTQQTDAPIDQDGNCFGTK